MGDQRDAASVLGVEQSDSTRLNRLELSQEHQNISLHFVMLARQMKENKHSHPEGRSLIDRVRCKGQDLSALVS